MCGRIKVSVWCITTKLVVIIYIVVTFYLVVTPRNKNNGSVPEYKWLVPIVNNLLLAYMGEFYSINSVVAILNNLCADK